MKCRTVRKELLEFVDGELSGERRDAVEDHLRECAACAAEAASLRAAEEALGGLAAVASAPELRDDLRRRLASVSPRAVGRRWMAAAAIGAVAFVLWLCTSYGWSPRVGRGQERVTAEKPAAVTSEARQEKVQDAAPPADVAEAPQQPALRSAKYSGPVPEQSGSGDSGPGSPGPEEVAPPEEAPKNSVSAPNELPREDVDFAAAAEEGPAGGIILLLGEARDVPPSSSCYLEIVFPDGARRVMNQHVERDASGSPRTVQIAYENIPVGTTVP